MHSLIFYEYSAPRTIEKIKILGPFWSYQLNSTANLQLGKFKSSSHEDDPDPWYDMKHYTLQIYTAGIGTHVKSVKVTSICHRYYHVKV